MRPVALHVHSLLSYLIFLFRHLEKKAAEEKEKERQERRRKERKHRDAFVELLQRHVSDGVLVARMRWKVCLTHALKST